MAKKVLICDDEIYVRELVSSVVVREGYEALTADNGNTSLEMAWREAPDLIILDLRMPGKTGFEVCEELKKKAKTKNTYIIILTGSWLDLNTTWDREARPDCVITKPFAPRKLRQKLHEVLDN